MLLITLIFFLFNNTIEYQLKEFIRIADRETSFFSFEISQIKSLQKTKILNFKKFKIRGEDFKFYLHVRAYQHLIIAQSFHGFFLLQRL